MMLVCRRRSRPGSRFSVIKFWLDLTATPLHTHKEQRTSRTYNETSQQDRYDWRCSPEKIKSWLQKYIYLVIASMFVQKRNDRFDVVLLDDVKHFRTFNKDTIQHLQNAWQLKYAHTLPFNQQGPITFIKSILFIKESPPPKKTKNKYVSSWIQAFK